MSDLQKMASLALNAAGYEVEKTAGPRTDAFTYNAGKAGTAVSGMAGAVRDAIVDAKGNVWVKATELGGKAKEMGTSGYAAAKGYAGQAGTAVANAGKAVGTHVVTHKGRYGMAAGAAALGAGAYYAGTRKEASLEEVGYAKAAAAELYQDAMEKMAFAESLWAECDQEFVKLAADNGPGEEYGQGDQMTSVGGVAPVPDGQQLADGSMAPGALNSFIEQFRKQRAVAEAGK